MFRKKNMGKVISEDGVDENILKLIKGIFRIKE